MSVALNSSYIVQFFQIQVNRNFWYTHIDNKHHKIIMINTNKIIQNSFDVRVLCPTTNSHRGKLCQKFVIMEVQSWIYCDWERADKFKTCMVSYSIDSHIYRSLWGGSIFIGDITEFSVLLATFTVKKRIFYYLVFVKKLFLK